MVLRVGLTGGYATGKTFVARELARLGCHVIFADELGHAVLEPGGEAFAAAVAAFGSDILDGDGRIDRKKLGTIVFANPEKLALLSSFVHPAVRRMEAESIVQWSADYPNGIAVVEAAILVEIGRQRDFHRLILTTCDPAIQIERARKRDHLSDEEIQSRMARQLPFHVKQQWAHWVIDTSRSKEETMGRIEDVFNELCMVAAT